MGRTHFQSRSWPRTGNPLGLLMRCVKIRLARQFVIWVQLRFWNIVQMWRDLFLRFSATISSTSWLLQSLVKRLNRVSRKCRSRPAEVPPFWFFFGGLDMVRVKLLKAWLQAFARTSLYGTWLLKMEITTQYKFVVSRYRTIIWSINTFDLFWLVKTTMDKQSQYTIL